MWSLSVGVSVLVTAMSTLDKDMVTDTVMLVATNLVHTLPTLLLAIIYTKIFRAAHTSSERARRNSAVRWVSIVTMCG